MVPHFSVKLVQKIVIFIYLIDIYLLGLFYFDALIKLVDLFKSNRADNLGFESIEEFVEKYDLFNQAVKLETLSREMRQKLISSWADKMHSAGHQLQAALL